MHFFQTAPFLFPGACITDAPILPRQRNITLAIIGLGQKWGCIDDFDLQPDFASSKVQRRATAIATGVLQLQQCFRSNLICMHCLQWNTLQCLLVLLVVIGSPWGQRSLPVDTNGLLSLLLQLPLSLGSQVSLNIATFNRFATFTGSISPITDYCGQQTLIRTTSFPSCPQPKSQGIFNCIDNRQGHRLKLGAESLR